MPELHDMADTLAVLEHDGLGRHDLLFKIEQKLLDAEHTLMGEGVLEVLPEGYGFLRSQDWNYLYSPDDIYVSPSQIKRFDLRTGDTVSGQVRPPKEWERYLALSLADGCDEIHHAHAEVVRRGLEADAAVRVARPKVVELDARLGGVGLPAVHRLDLEEREVAFP